MRLAQFVCLVVPRSAAHVFDSASNPRFFFYSFVVMADTLLEIENKISHDRTFVHNELARVLYFAQMLQRRK